MNINNSKINREELKSACEALGLNYSDFVEEPTTLEKGVNEDNTDWKDLYYQQLEANQKLIQAIGDSSKKSGEQISELQKGFNDLYDKFETLGSSPMHNRKSYNKESVRVIEKSFNGGDNSQAEQVYSISKDNKALKAYLGDKMMEDLKSNIRKGVFEKAAMQLDASHCISNDLIATILKREKVLITQ